MRLLLLLCLTLLPLTFAASVFDPALITPLASDSFRAATSAPNVATVVLFYHHKNVKEVVPQYATTAKSIGQNVKPMSIDCSASTDICDEQNVADDAPTLKMFVNGKSFVYKGVQKHKEMTQWIWDTLPNLVTLFTNKLSKQPRKTTVPRVLLFTDKRETSPMLKSLAIQFNKQLEVVEVRKSERALLDKYGIGKNFPVLMVETSDEKTKMYTGKFERALLVAWLESFIEKKGANGEKAVSNIPEIADLSCLNMYCASPLCIVLVATNQSSDYSRTLEQFEAVANVNKDSTFRFVAIDSIVHQDWLADNFDIQLQNFPQIFMLSMKKERFVPYIGTFNNEGILDFLKGIKKGASRIMPFITRDAKLTTFKNDTITCTKPAAPEKKKTDAPVEEGKLYILTDKTYDSVVEQSRNAWMLLFHKGQSHSSIEQYKNLTDDFTRVAKKMKDMVRFGRIDVEKQVGLEEKLGISEKDLPCIRTFDYSLDSKTPDQLHAYTGADMTARSIMDASTALLTKKHVSEVTSQSMQTFMGDDVRPGYPFQPKFVLFAKPTPENQVKIPEMFASLSMEFHQHIKFGVAKSTERQLGQQFNVTRIPSLFVLSLDAHGAQDKQIRVSASQYGGPLTYGAIHSFCMQVEKQYSEIVKQFEKANPKEKRAEGRTRSEYKPDAVEESEDINLDKEEL